MPQFTPRGIARQRTGKWGPGTLGQAEYTEEIKEEYEERRDIFETIFGPRTGFATRQAVRDEYQSLAGRIRRMPNDTTLSAQVRAVALAYLGRLDGVIARGATESDLSEIKLKLEELNRMIAQTTVVGTRPVGIPPDVTGAPGVSPALAGMPWYVWAIAAGILLPMILKK